jgi:uncharacterized protein
LAKSAVWRQVVAEEAYEATLREARERWQIADHPANYRWTHVQAVVRLALRLAELTGADRDVVEASAWLHDCAKIGKDDDHGLKGSIKAKKILRATDFPQEKVKAVVDAISKHVGLWTEEPVEPLEAAILWDADKLSKLGVASAMQNIGYWVMVKRGPVDDLPGNMAAQDWREKTVASFHTEPARVAGRQRLAAQQAFWQQVEHELGGGDLGA